MHLQLTPVADNDERAGYQSASEYGRLLKCRASFLMTKKAKALGQVAHERSPASDLGTKLHLANIEGPDTLTPKEREDWETCQHKRAAFLTQWTADCTLPVAMAKEERVWLRKGLRPLLSGKPDEVLRQGPRVAVLDHKYGNYRVADPRDNISVGALRAGWAVGADGWTDATAACGDPGIQRFRPVGTSAAPRSGDSRNTGSFGGCVSIEQVQGTYTREEREFLDWMERSEGRPLTQLQKNLSIRQAQQVGHLPQRDEQSPSETTKEKLVRLAKEGENLPKPTQQDWECSVRPYKNTSA